MKPNFAIVQAGDPHQSEFLRENLYDYLGWPDLKDKPAFRDTCAIRMSVAINRKASRTTSLADVYKPEVTFHRTISSSCGVKFIRVS
jgi:hypothetical protein